MQFFAVGASLLLIAVLIVLARRLRRQPLKTRPPLAPGARPFIGHALAYKTDPAGFLAAACNDVGPIFEINLAGKRMVVIGPSREAIRQATIAPESVLSARQAVADIGFNETLGPLNVFKGTDLHKRWLKETFGGGSGGALNDEIAPMWDALASALRTEAATSATQDAGYWSHGAPATIADLFGFVRRTVLRCQCERLLGSAVLLAAGDGAFIECFMAFQDSVEDATAKAAVLPRLVSLPLVLWPSALRRYRIVRRLTAAIKDAERAAAPGEGNHGSWLAFARSAVLSRFSKTPVREAEAAELAVGLLFASHKNPAIGAAQAVCTLMELGEGHPTVVSAREEASRLAADPSAKSLDECHTIQRVLLETLRLGAHAIGAVRTVAAPCGFVIDGRFWVGKGETIALSHIAVHRHRASWGEDCEKFREGRPQYDAPGRAGALLDDLSFTTFSQGLHKCPGEKLALRTMECVIAQLLLRRVGPVGPLPPVSFERATLAQRGGAVPVRLQLDATRARGKSRVGMRGEASWGIWPRARTRAEPPGPGALPGAGRSGSSSCKQE
jgi:cytochrome P450